MIRLRHAPVNIIHMSTSRNTDMQDTRHVIDAPNKPSYERCITPFVSIHALSYLPPFE